MENLYCIYHNDIMPDGLSKNKNKILVCIDSNRYNNVLVQKALETAEVFDCPVEGIYVETQKHYKLDERALSQLKSNITKAQNRGILVHQATGASASEVILQFAQENKFNKILVGTSPKSFIKNILKPSLHQNLVQNRLNIEINTLPLPKKKNKSKLLALLVEKQNAIGYLTSAIVISSITLLGRILDANAETIGYSPSLYNEAMIMLLGVLFCAVRFGVLPGVLASFLGFFSLNFFFIQPVMYFSVDNPNDYLSLSVLLLSGLLTSTFGGLSRQQIRNLRLRDTQSQSAIRLNEVVANVTNEDKALELLQEELSRISNSNSILFLLDEAKNIRKQSKEITGLSIEERKLLKEVIDKEEANKIWVLNKSKYHFEPVFSDNNLIAILAIEETQEMYNYVSRLYESLAKQCGLVLTNIKLAADIENSKIREEREQLRSALLSSVSHDLKTPLASIIGSLSAVKQMGDKLDAESKDELLLTALEEAERLNGFISNILDMTKLESKAVVMNKDWFSFEDIANQVLKTLKFRAKDHEINFIKPVKNIDLYIDRMLFAQVLQNILDNAIKYSPKKSIVTLSIKIDENDNPIISILDEGDGITDKDKPKVFDKFTRLKMKDHKVAGTGLGLAICKIVIEQHDGKIFIEDNPAGKGTAFKIKLNKHKINE